MRYKKENERKKKICWKKKKFRGGGRKKLLIVHYDIIFIIINFSVLFVSVKYLSAAISCVSFFAQLWWAGKLNFFLFLHSNIISREKNIIIEKEKNSWDFSTESVGVEVKEP